MGWSFGALLDQPASEREAARPMQASSSSDACEVQGMAEIPEDERQKLVGLFVALVALYRHKRRDFDAAECVIASFARELPQRAVAKARVVR